MIKTRLADELDSNTSACVCGPVHKGLFRLCKTSGKDKNSPSQHRCITEKEVYCFWQKKRKMFCSSVLKINVKQEVF